MKRVSKAPKEPQALAEYRNRYENSPTLLSWNRFKKVTDRRESVKAQMREDQRGLCAYCENQLKPVDESVEHFVARTGDRERELDWSNLLLVCLGGEKSTEDEVSDSNATTSTRLTCGHAKRNRSEQILNPLGLPSSPCLFRFESEKGEAAADVTNCQRSGVDSQLVEQTIQILNLNAGRLSRARESVLDEILTALDLEFTSPRFSIDREMELAAALFPAQGPLPAFFSTIRFALGAGAEAQLKIINFIG